jgi:glycosyltransferase involved in cell wall biosynthesis
MNRGGAETLLMNLYRNIDRAKVQFDFLTSKEGVFDEEIMELGGIIHKIPFVTEIGHFGYLRALEHFFATHQEYAVVHSHMDKMSGLVLRSAQKAGIPKRIAHSHSTRSEGGLAKQIYKWYAGKFIGESSTHLMACSDKAAKWLFSAKAKDTQILKNGIDPNQFAFSSSIKKEVRTELNISGDSLVVGHVGRFDKPKNQAFLIDTFQHLLEQFPNAVLILIGDGPLRTEMENKVKHLGISENVKFLGIRSDVNRLLQAFDVFGFPSIFEGLPLTLIEAQGSGLPCIISDTITQEVDLGINLVEYSSITDKGIWVEKIKRAAARNQSRVISARTFSAKGYDIKNTAAWTQEFYLAISR